MVSDLINDASESPGEFKDTISPHLPVLRAFVNSENSTACCVHESILSLLKHTWE